MRKTPFRSWLSAVLVSALLIDPHWAQAMRPPARLAAPLVMAPFEQCALKERAFYFNAFDHLFEQWPRLRSKVFRRVSPISRLERTWPWVLAAAATLYGLKTAFYPDSFVSDIGTNSVGLASFIGFLAIKVETLLLFRHPKIPVSLLYENPESDEFHAMSRRLETEVKEALELVKIQHPEMEDDEAIAMSVGMRNVLEDSRVIYRSTFSEGEEDSYPAIFWINPPEGLEFFMEGGRASCLHFDPNAGVAYLSLPLYQALASTPINPKTYVEVISQYLFLRMSGDSHEGALQLLDPALLAQIDQFLENRLVAQLEAERQAKEAEDVKLSAQAKRELVKLVKAHGVELMSSNQDEWLGQDWFLQKEKRDPAGWVDRLQRRVIALSETAEGTPLSYEEALKEWVPQYSFYPHATGKTYFGHLISEGYHLINKRAGKRLTLGNTVITKGEFADIGITPAKWEKAKESYETKMREANEVWEYWARPLSILRDIDTVKVLLEKAGLSDEDQKQLLGFVLVAAEQTWASDFDVSQLLLRAGEKPFSLSEEALARIIEAADRLALDAELTSLAQKRLLSPAARMRGPVGLASEKAKEGPSGNPLFWNRWAEAYTKIFKQFAAYPIKIFAVGRALVWMERQDLPYALKASQIKTVLAGGSGPMILLHALAEIRELLVRLGIAVARMRVISLDFAFNMLVHGKNAASRVPIASDAVAANLTEILPFKDGSIDFYESGIFGTIGDDVNREGVSKKIHFLLEANRVLHGPEQKDSDPKREGRGGLLVLTVKNKPIPENLQEVLAQFGFEIVSEKRPRVSLLGGLLCKLTHGEHARDKASHLKTQVGGASMLFAVKRRTLSPTEIQRLRASSTEPHIVALRVALTYDDSLKTQEKHHPTPRHWNGHARRPGLERLEWKDVQPEELLPPIIKRTDILIRHPDFIKAFDHLEVCRFHNLLSVDHDQRFDDFQRGWDNPAIVEFEVEEVEWILKRVQERRGYKGRGRTRPTPSAKEPPSASPQGTKPKASKPPTLWELAERLNRESIENGKGEIFNRERSASELLRLSAIHNARFMLSVEDALEQLGRLFPGASLAAFTVEFLLEWALRAPADRSWHEINTLFTNTGLRLEGDVIQAVCRVFGIPVFETTRDETSPVKNTRNEAIKRALGELQAKNTNPAAGVRFKPVLIIDLIFAVKNARDEVDRNRRINQILKERRPSIMDVEPDDVYSVLLTEKLIAAPDPVAVPETSPELVQTPGVPVLGEPAGAQPSPAANDPEKGSTPLVIALPQIPPSAIEAAAAELRALIHSKGGRQAPKATNASVLAFLDKESDPGKITSKINHQFGVSLRRDEVEPILRKHGLWPVTQDQVNGENRQLDDKAIAHLREWVLETFEGKKINKETFVPTWEELVPEGTPYRQEVISHVEQYASKEFGVNQRDQYRTLYSLVGLINRVIGPQGALLQAYFHPQEKKWEIFHIRTKPALDNTYHIDGDEIRAYEFLGLPKDYTVRFPGEQYGIGWNHLKKTAEFFLKEKGDTPMQKAFVAQMKQVDATVDRLARTMDLQKLYSQLALAAACNTSNRLHQEASDREKILYERETPLQETLPWVVFAQKLLRKKGPMGRLYIDLTSELRGDKKQPRFDVAEGVSMAYGALVSMARLENPLIGTVNIFAQDHNDRMMTVDALMLLYAFSEQLGMSVELKDLIIERDAIYERLIKMTPAELKMLAQEVLRDNFLLELDMTDIRHIKTKVVEQEATDPAITESKTKEEAVAQLKGTLEQSWKEGHLLESWSSTKTMLESTLGEMPEEVKRAERLALDSTIANRFERAIRFTEFLAALNRHYLNGHGYFIAIDENQRMVIEEIEKAKETFRVNPTNEEMTVYPLKRIPMDTEVVTFHQIAGAATAFPKTYGIRCANGLSAMASEVRRKEPPSMKGIGNSLNQWLEKAFGAPLQIENIISPIEGIRTEQALANMTARLLGRNAYRNSTVEKPLLEQHVSPQAVEARSFILAYFKPKSSLRNFYEHNVSCQKDADTQNNMAHAMLWVYSFLNGLATHEKPSHVLANTLTVVASEFRKSSQKNFTHALELSALIVHVFPDLASQISENKNLMSLYTPNNVARLTHTLLTYSEDQLRDLAIQVMRDQFTAQINISKGLIEIDYFDAKTKDVSDELLEEAQMILTELKEAFPVEALGLTLQLAMEFVQNQTVEGALKLLKAIGAALDGGLAAALLDAVGSSLEALYDKIWAPMTLTPVQITALSGDIDRVLLPMLADKRLTPERMDALLGVFETHFKVPVKESLRHDVRLLALASGDGASKESHRSAVFLKLNEDYLKPLGYLIDPSQISYSSKSLRSVPIYRILEAPIVYQSADKAISFYRYTIQVVSSSEFSGQTYHLPYFYSAAIGVLVNSEAVMKEAEARIQNMPQLKTQARILQTGSRDQKTVFRYVSQVIKWDAKAFPKNVKLHDLAKAREGALLERILVETAAIKWAQASLNAHKDYPLINGFHWQDEMNSSLDIARTAFAIDGAYEFVETMTNLARLQATSLGQVRQFSSIFSHRFAYLHAMRRSPSGFLANRFDYYFVPKISGVKPEQLGARLGAADIQFFTDLASHVLNKSYIGTIAPNEFESMMLKLSDALLTWDEARLTDLADQMLRKTYRITVNLREDGQIEIVPMEKIDKPVNARAPQQLTTPTLQNMLSLIIEPIFKAGLMNDDQADKLRAVLAIFVDGLPSEVQEALNHAATFTASSQESYDALHEFLRALNTYFLKPGGFLIDVNPVGSSNKGDIPDFHLRAYKIDNTQSQVYRIDGTDLNVPYNVAEESTPADPTMPMWASRHYGLRLLNPTVSALVNNSLPFLLLCRKNTALYNKSPGQFFPQDRGRIRAQREVARWLDAALGEAPTQLNVTNLFGETDKEKYLSIVSALEIARHRLMSDPTKKSELSASGIPWAEYDHRAFADYYVRKGSLAETLLFETMHDSESVDWEGHERQQNASFISHLFGFLHAMRDDERPKSLAADFIHWFGWLGTNKKGSKIGFQAGTRLYVLAHYLNLAGQLTVKDFAELTPLAIEQMNKVSQALRDMSPSDRKALASKILEDNFTLSFDFLPDQRIIMHDSSRESISSQNASDSALDDEDLASIAKVIMDQLIKSFGQSISTLTQEMILSILRRADPDHTHAVLQQAELTKIPGLKEWLTQTVSDILNIQKGMKLPVTPEILKNTLQVIFGDAFNRGYLSEGDHERFLFLPNAYFDEPLPRTFKDAAKHALTFTSATPESRQSLEKVVLSLNDYLRPNGYQFSVDPVWSEGKINWVIDVIHISSKPRATYTVEGFSDLIHVHEGIVLASGKAIEHSASSKFYGITVWPSIAEQNAKRCLKNIEASRVNTSPKAASKSKRSPLSLSAEREMVKWSDKVFGRNVEHGQIFQAFLDDVAALVGEHAAYVWANHNVLGSAPQDEAFIEEYLRQGSYLWHLYREPSDRESLFSSEEIKSAYKAHRFVRLFGSLQKLRQPKAMEYLALLMFKQLTTISGKHTLDVDYQEAICFSLLARACDMPADWKDFIKQDLEAVKLFERLSARLLQMDNKQLRALSERIIEENFKIYLEFMPDNHIVLQPTSKPNNTPADPKEVHSLIKDRLIPAFEDGFVPEGWLQDFLKNLSRQLAENAPISVTQAAKEAEAVHEGGPTCYRALNHFVKSLNSDWLERRGVVIALVPKNNETKPGWHVEVYRVDPKRSRRYIFEGKDYEPLLWNVGELTRLDGSIAPFEAQFDRHPHSGIVFFEKVSHVFNAKRLNTLAFAIRAQQVLNTDFPFTQHEKAVSDWFRVFVDDDAIPERISQAMHEVDRDAALVELAAVENGHSLFREGLNKQKADQFLRDGSMARRAYYESLNRAPHNLFAADVLLREFLVVYGWLHAMRKPMLARRTLARRALLFAIILAEKFNQKDLKILPEEARLLSLLGDALMGEKAPQASALFGEKGVVYAAQVCDALKELPDVKLAALADRVLRENFTQEVEIDGQVIRFKPLELTASSEVGSEEFDEVAVADAVEAIKAMMASQKQASQIDAKWVKMLARNGERSFVANHFSKKGLALRSGKSIDDVMRILSVLKSPRRDLDKPTGRMSKELQTRVEKELKTTLREGFINKKEWDKLFVELEKSFGERPDSLKTVQSDLFAPPKERSFEYMQQLFEFVRRLNFDWLRSYGYAVIVDSNQGLDPTSAPWAIHVMQFNPENTHLYTIDHEERMPPVMVDNVRGNSPFNAYAMSFAGVGLLRPNFNDSQEAQVIKNLAAQKAYAQSHLEDPEQYAFLHIYHWLEKALSPQPSGTRASEQRYEIALYENVTRVVSRAINELYLRNNAQALESAYRLTPPVMEFSPIVFTNGYMHRKDLFGTIATTFDLKASVPDVRWADHAMAISIWQAFIQINAMHNVERPSGVLRNTLAVEILNISTHKSKFMLREQLFYFALIQAVGLNSKLTFEVYARLSEQKQLEILMELSEKLLKYSEDDLRALAGKILQENFKFRLDIDTTAHTVKVVNFPVKASFPLAPILAAIGTGAIAAFMSFWSQASGGATQLAGFGGFQTFLLVGAAFPMLMTALDVHFRNNPETPRRFKAAA